MRNIRDEPKSIGPGHKSPDPALTSRRTQIRFDTKARDDAANTERAIFWPCHNVDLSLNSELTADQRALAQLSPLPVLLLLY